MKLYKKYKEWSDTWSMSQLIFLATIVVLLGGAALFATHKLELTQEELIKALTIQK